MTLFIRLGALHSPLDFVEAGLAFVLMAIVYVVVACCALMVLVLLFAAIAAAFTRDKDEDAP